MVRDSRLLVGDSLTAQWPFALPPAESPGIWGSGEPEATGKADRSIYGIATQSQEEKATGRAGDKQKTAALAN